MRPASRMLSAISFGVFCRSAPSTRAIIRSMKLSPGLVVILTTMRSDRTRVPPVTALRSPPDSRITGADSPVMADSSTDAMPSTTSPSPGITSPGPTTHRSPIFRSVDATCLRRSVRLANVGHRLRPGPAQRVRLRLAATFGHRFGEVGEQHREPQPDRDECGEAVDVADGEQRRHDAADLDDEHHRIARLRARVQLDERVDDGPLAGSPARTSMVARALRVVRIDLRLARFERLETAVSRNGHVRCAPRTFPVRCSTTGPSETTGK